MENNKVIGTGWLPTGDVIETANIGMEQAFEGTGYKLKMSMVLV